MAPERLVQEAPYRFRIERRGAMRVPGILYASPALLAAAGEDKALEQVANVACLPGIVRGSYAMPDMHWGYGFPIGGVAATDVEHGGVVSPGGVGFDISCGVRLLVARDLRREELAPALRRMMDRLDRLIPRGVGPGALWAMRDEAQLRRVLQGGARYAVEEGHGVPRDLNRCEDHGTMLPVDLAGVSRRALERGLDEVGSLGSGNHFLEVQGVEEVFDARAAAAMGLAARAVCVMIHCGSRGLGHQICTDHLGVVDRVMAAHSISVPDRQLACAPVLSAEGQAYLGAMAAAANYGRANRQLLAEAVCTVFEQHVDTTLDLVYDVSHNLARLEIHDVDGQPTTLCVHRKGATRAAPPHDPDLPPELAEIGQPVLIPGTMGTASYVLAGVAGNPAFGSTAHGAGRVMSRHQAAKGTSGRLLKERLEADGILVRGASWRGLAEEKPEAYKDIEAVVEVSDSAGLARKVARLVPLGAVKG
jgi:tRNA-splicing ligase RtcB